MSSPERGDDPASASVVANSKMSPRARRNMLSPLQRSPTKYASACWEEVWQGSPFLGQAANRSRPITQSLARTGGIARQLGGRHGCPKGPRPRAAAGRVGATGQAYLSQAASAAR